MVIDTNEGIILITKTKGLHFETFKTFEDLLDQVIIKYYKDLRQRFNMAPDLKHIVTKRVGVQLKKLMDADKKLFDYSPGYAKLKAAEEKNIG